MIILIIEFTDKLDERKLCIFPIYGIKIKFLQTQDVRKVVVRMVRDVCSGKKLRGLLYFFYPLISITGFSRARGINVRNRLQLYVDVLRAGFEVKRARHAARPFRRLAGGGSRPHNSISDPNEQI